MHGKIREHIFSTPPKKNIYFNLKSERGAKGKFEVLSTSYSIFTGVQKYFSSSEIILLQRYA